MVFLTREQTSAGCTTGSRGLSLDQDIVEEGRKLALDLVPGEVNVLRAFRAFGVVRVVSDVLAVLLRVACWGLYKGFSAFKTKVRVPNAVL